MRMLVILTGLLLGACGSQEPVAPAKAATSPIETAMTAAGPAANVTADDDENLQWAASVVRVDPLKRQGGRTVKLFAVGGGDPAMNGLQTHVAFFRSPAEGWAVFRIGDVLDYRIVSEGPGRVDLELAESRLNEATGEIGSGTRRVIVGWAVPTDGSTPATVTVTPAR